MARMWSGLWTVLLIPTLIRPALYLNSKFFGPVGLLGFINKAQRIYI